MFSDLEKRYGCAISVPLASERRRYVWVAYSSNWPNLPVASADTAQQLADKVGTTVGNIESCWSKFKTGKRRYSKYHKVYIG